MRLYKSKRFAVYAQHDGGCTSVVVYGAERSPAQLNTYHLLMGETETFVLNLINEGERADIEAWLAAYTAMEEPYNADLHR